MPELPPTSAPAATSAAPAPPPSESKQPAVPQSSIAAELSRVYDEKAKAAPEGRGTAISPGQGNVAPEAKARDESGRFAPKEPAKDAKPETKDAKDTKAPPAKDDKAAPDEKKEAPKADADTKSAEAKAADEKTAKERAEKAAKLQPHPRWKPEEKERFQKLAESDPDSAEFVLRREKESEKFITQASQAASKFKGLEDILAPGRQARSLHGVDDATYMRSLVAASDFLAKEPQRGLRMLAEQYGIDLKELAEGKTTEAQESPVVRQLQTELHQLKQHIASQNQGAQQQRMHGALQTIEAFKNEKDEQGQARYPHFDAVVDDITTVVARQLEAGQPVNLKAAYEKAIRLNDSVWTKIQAANSETQRKQREEEEARRVADAKLAGFSVSGSGVAGDSVAGSIRDELRRQIEKSFR